MATDHFDTVLKYKESKNVAVQVDEKELLIALEVSKEKHETPSSINLEQFKKLTKSKSKVLQNLIQMTIESFYLYKLEYEELVAKRDQKKVGLLTHKLKLTSNLLCAFPLEEAIKHARKLLADEPEHDSQIQQAILNIQLEFDNCINELQNSLNALKGSK